ncbi:MAG: hypothetical protein KBC98_01700 [Candidatus Pacebacteria bacterium]|nr:hypothetical protein [Candidatus Paceibacterota bacterium]
MIKDKETLLETPMNRLGLGNVFNKYFLQQTMRQDQVFTVNQFFEANKSIRQAITRGIVCVSTSTTIPFRKRFIKRSSKPFQVFLEFLTSHGFTSRDWIMLLPKGVAGRLDYGKLSHEQLKTLPVFQVTYVTATGRPMKWIAAAFFGDERQSSSISVQEILMLNQKDVFKKISKKGKEYYSVLYTFSVIQKKLVEYGFGTQYAFMKIDFSK